MTSEPQTSTVRVTSPWARLSRLLLVLVLVAAAGAVQEDHWFIKVGAVVVTLLFVGLVVYSASVAVMATPDGIVVRSPLRRTRRLSWKQIDHFEVRGYWRVLGLWTADEHWVPLLPHGAFSGEAMTALGRLEQYRRRQIDPNR